MVDTFPALQNLALDAIDLFCCRILVQNGAMIFGYARVSTDGQSINAQVAALRKHGAGKVFREVASGAKTDLGAAPPCDRPAQRRRRADGDTP